MKQPVYANIPIRIRGDWMQYELASFEAFKAVNHCSAYEDHVYSIICSHFATDLVIRGEESLVALIVSAANTTFRQESPDNWKQVFDVLQSVISQFSLSDESKAIIGQYIIKE